MYTDRQAVSFCLSIVSCTRKVGGVEGGGCESSVRLTRATQDEACVSFLLGQHEAVSKCGG